MRKKFFNYLIQNSVKKLIVIAFFCAFLPLPAAHALSYAGDSGIIPCSVATPSAPIWAKLVLSGNTVTCFYATGTGQPYTWTQMGTPKTINFLNHPILVGLYVVSYNSTSVSTGTVDNFSITPTPSYQLQDFDVGQPALMGSANLINGVWNLAGGGANIGAASDQFNFQSWLVWGDCTVVCRITSIAGTLPSSRIGIMIRDGFNSGSDFAMFGARQGSGIDFMYRTSFNNNADIIQYVVPPAPGVKSGVAVGYGLTGGTTYTVRP